MTKPSVTPLKADDRLEEAQDTGSDEERPGTAERGDRCQPGWQGQQQAR